jgi:hypothetical protein
MPLSHRHHYVSQFYLKNFVADRDNPRLFVADLQKRATFMTSPSNVALENDFHTIEVNGEPSDVVERMFSSFEADVAPALARVINQASFENADDREHVLFFVTLLLIKNPQFRARVNAFTNDVMQMTQKVDAADPDRWAKKVQEAIADGTLPPNTNAEHLRQLMLAGAFKFSLSPEAMLHQEFALAQKSYPIVAARRWNILRAEEGEFITSDAPAMLMWKDPRRDDSPGLGVPETRLLVPLSSTVTISGGFELEDATFGLSMDEVAKVNGQVIVQARRQVFASSEVFQYALPHNDRLRSGGELIDDDLVIGRSSGAPGSGAAN